VAHSTKRAPSRVRALIVQTGRLVRLVWLGAGVVLVLLLALELAFRAQAALRGSILARSGPAIPSDLAAAQPWRGQLTAEASSASLAWRPYVYFRRRPFHGRYVTVDSLGRRWTLQAGAPGTAPRDVFLFGGSPLWGGGLRDSMTIPSRLSRELAALGIRDLEITNFGESGYVFTQEVIELLLQLRAGARPALVVFYDGYNDVDAALASGVAGATKSEKDRARDFDLGRALFPWRTDPATEARVALLLGSVAASRLQLLRPFRPRSEPLPAAAAHALAEDVTRSYLRTVEVVEALARHYGFVAIYARMPILQPGGKRLSPYERAVAAAMQGEPTTQDFLLLYRLVEGRLARGLRDLAPGRSLDFSTLFAADSATVYLDDQAHITESASATVAAELARHLAPLLMGPARRPGATARRAR